MRSTTPTAVTAAVIIESGRVLLAQRPLSGRHPGAWEFPGGKVEQGETPEQCLARELREELGVEVQIERPFPAVRHSYPDLDIELLAFECRLTGGRPRDMGCRAHAWVEPERLEEYDLLPPDRRIASMLVERRG